MVATTGYTFGSDGFDGEPLSGIWSAGWGGTAPGVTDEVFASVAYNSTVQAVRDALDPALDTSQAYSIELLIVPYNGAHHGTYLIYAKMDDSSTDGSDDVAV